MQAIQHSSFAAEWLAHFRSSFSWAWMDIRCRYRRSVIGPFWETINVFVLLVGMAFVSAAIFGTSPVGNLPYIGLGIIVWYAVFGIVNESTSCFIMHKDLIKNSTLNMDVYIGRTICRVFITTGHHLILYFIGVALLPVPVGVVSLLSLVGWALLFLNAFWVMPVLGILCARYRDLEMIVRNIMQLIFYATPVFWDYRLIADKRSIIIDYNPFFYFMEIIRAPLLGKMPPLAYYEVVAGITVFGFVLLWYVNRHMRRYLAFYV